MENLLTELVTGAGVIIASFFISSLFFKKRKLFDFEEEKRKAEDLIEKGKKEADKILKETKEQIIKVKEAYRLDVEKKEERIKKLEEVLNYREKTTDRKEDKINELRLKVASYKEALQTIQEGTKRVEKEIKEKLSAKTGITTTQLKENILEEYRRSLEEKNEENLSRIEEELKENAIKTAKKILVDVMQRLCSPTSVETKAVLIEVPKDYIKGKIVGREGKNIEEFEKTLDVDIIFNDLPNTISVSSYNLVNRRIAEKAINKLIKHKAEIDKNTVQKSIKEAEKEMDRELSEIGQAAVNALGLKNLDPELVRTIGRLQFRTSYGQNIMKHSMEVAWAAAMLGSELGLDVKVCKIAGFLHDLGKAIDQNPDVQGAHDFLTKELMEKYKFSEAEVHAAWTHHESAPLKTPEALIVKAADAISAGRPGARQESIEKYIERLQALERTGNSFEGVSNSFAISAGRELRINVDPEKIKDELMKPLAGEIAKKIERELSYPGKIKVNVIRRTKHTETTK